MPKPKICKHCHWVYINTEPVAWDSYVAPGRDSTTYHCYHPELINLVTGDPTKCEDQRNNERKDCCGHDGRFFTRKEEN